jgi:sugar (pentulose or hexulose) kinase
MSSIILVDFGASRIKSAIWSLAQNKIIATRECPSPTPFFGLNGEVEIVPELYFQALESTAGELLKLNQTIDSMWLCTEMHGFLIASAESGEPLTPYISWRDERADFKSLANIAGDFFVKTGMKLRPGLPFVTLSHLEKSKKLPTNFRIFTLADWLLWRGGERDPGINISLAAGTGFFSLKEKKWSADFQKIIFSRVVETEELLGQIKLANRTIKVFGGIGDLQAAIHGAGFPAQSSLIVNLGTGSQVIGTSLQKDVEIRPSVEGKNFSAITHIPSGRALNVWANFFADCAKENFFWEIFSSLSVEEVLSSELEIDLNIFEASWRYKGGGAVSRIREGKFSPQILIAAVANAWLKQYSEAISKIDPAADSKTFLLSGGLSRRGKFILPALESLTKREAILTSTITGEETLDGLLALAKKFYK